MEAHPKKFTKWQILATYAMENAYNQMQNEDNPNGGVDGEELEDEIL